MSVTSKWNRFAFDPFLVKTNIFQQFFWFTEEQYKKIWPLHPNKTWEKFISKADVLEKFDQENLDTHL